MGALENFECPPVCVRALTGTHVGHNRRTLPQDSSARMAGRGRVRGLKFEVFRISNLGSCLFRMSRASRVTVCDADELFQHPAKTTLFGPSEKGSLTVEPFR